MYYISFKCEDKHVFSISHKNYPLPRIGDLVTYNTDHYEVKSIRHRFAEICGPESTGITIRMTRRRERDILEV
jgi:hypothetical protein